MILSTKPRTAEKSGQRQKGKSKKLVKVAAVIPAYNEANRIGVVLTALANTAEVSEVIVVSDGSTDGTHAVASRYPKVTAVQLERNQGKGGAMRVGALRTDADVIVFFDADLVGLTPEHVSSLLAPVITGEVTMAMGIFKGGRWATDIAQYFSPGITGQRAVRREVFLQIPGLEHVGYGIELAITYYVRHHDMESCNVTLTGVTHPLKEEKLGWVRGAASRTVMYWQMARFRVSYELHGRPPKSRKKKS